MMRTLTHRSAAQCPPFSTPQTLSPTCASNSNPILFLQRFITVLFLRPGGSSHYRPLRQSQNELPFMHHSVRVI
jgi:hypothetical protein